MSKKLGIKDKNIDLEQLILRLYYVPRINDQRDTFEIKKIFLPNLQRYME